jgi:hypothetical protein
MSTMIALSDAQMSAVLAACQPLAPPDREAFLCALANVLRSELQPLGDGAVFRAIRSLQREFWTPPKFAKHSTAVHHAAKGEPIP